MLVAKLAAQITAIDEDLARIDVQINEHFTRRRLSI